MKIIKRNGTEVPYDCEKIRAAISAANNEVDNKISDTVIGFLVGKVEQRCEALARPVHVEEIQDMVIDELNHAEAYKLARHYSEYRLLHEQKRKMNTTDGKILSLLERNNEEAKQENANKNPIINSTLRDYMAGEVSKDICRRFLFPEDIIAAHDEGIIHIHDLDYIAEPMYNCCLVNLEDMLQNGTVVSGTMIEKPHSFSTACNIATQIIAQVASNQYGGQTISLSHLAPFVDVSRQKIKAEVFEDVNCDCGCKLSDEDIDHIVEKRVRREVKRGVQTIQYQINTLLTTNGQTPFVTVFMYLDALTIDMAKELCMIQRTEIGKRCREYFLTIERHWNSPEAIMARALQFANQRLELIMQQNNELLETNSRQAKQIAEMQPKATYYDVVLNCPNVIPISTIAKDYGKSAVWLNKWLHDHEIQYRQGKVWLLYQKYADKGYTKSKTYAIPDDNGDSQAKTLTCWTMKGRLFLYDLLKSYGILPLIEQVTADDEA